MMSKICVLALVLLLPAIALSASIWPQNLGVENELEPGNEVFDNLNNFPVTKTNIQMPGVTPLMNDTYLCTSYALNNDDTNFLVGFDPIADMSGVHHVLLFGCENPGNKEEAIWDCGDMSHGKKMPGRASACASQSKIIYAWARNAPRLELPKGVAFRVGANTRNNYLVLQVHYMHAIDTKDYSGVAVISTSIPQPRTAATLLLVTGGQIKAQSTETLEAACVLNEPIVLHPFAFRTHTHRHGVKVGGWIVNEDETGMDSWTLIGERNPQLPQLFESIKNQSLTAAQGDIIAARCTMKNNEKRIIEVGPTGEDEMCNFYMMYWVNGDQTLSDNVCFSPGPPNYYWSREAGLNNIPK